MEVKDHPQTDVSVDEEIQLDNKYLRPVVDKNKKAIRKQEKKYKMKEKTNDSILSNSIVSDVLSEMIDDI
eukprot:TRINITY_DN13127_c0_g1_i1.p1 TRINITY_DN13127_c0_g1~~TRINITY_DN13127_c0_g1_i1.p1  ORF type:complete len:70 (-),score=18.50 TRINITY_DN13127_c0_g1_i1:10-219(-)